MLYICGYIDQKTYLDLCHYLDTCLKAKKGKKIPDVHIEICSQGGEFEYGLACYARIRQYPGTVYTYAVGMCHSAATLIYVAGDIRYISETAWTLLHESSYKLARGPHSAQMAEVKFAGELDKQYCKILAERSGFEEKLLEQLCKESTYLAAEECLDMGIAQRQTKEK